MISGCKSRKTKRKRGVWKGHIPVVVAVGRGGWEPIKTTSANVRLSSIDSTGEVCEYEEVS